MVRGRAGSDIRYPVGTCHAGWGHAFGLKTHIWIAQKLVADVQSSCRLTIETIPLIINEQVCQIFGSTRVPFWLARSVPMPTLT
jgi:hypothetical protein